MSTVEKSSVKIPSAHAGWDLDAWYYLPTGPFSKPYPVIIMAHGLGGTKSMRLDPYAETFASSGYACIIFDYRHWGTSDGMPRFIISIADQLEDYRTVIKWARQHDQLDPHRLVLWGTSFSGGHVISLSAETSINPAAIIAQCPYLGVMPPRPLSTATVKTALYAISNSIKQFFGFEPIYIPGVAAPGEVGALTTEGAQAAFDVLCRGLTDIPNKMNASGIFQVLTYKAMNNAAKVSCPLFIVAPEDDNLCSLWAAVDVAEKAQNGEIFKLPGAGHFDLYPTATHYEESISSQLQFLKKVVPV